MSSKRYRYKVVESKDAAELTQLLSEAGSQGWAAIGYGVLPGGERSALLQRKYKLHKRRHRHHGSHREQAHETTRALPADTANSQSKRRARSSVG